MPETLSLVMSSTPAGADPASAVAAAAPAKSSSSLGLLLQQKQQQQQQQAAAVAAANGSDRMSDVPAVVVSSSSNSSSPIAGPLARSLSIPALLAGSSAAASPHHHAASHRQQDASHPLGSSPSGNGVYTPSKRSKYSSPSHSPSIASPLAAALGALPPPSLGHHAAVAAAATAAASPLSPARSLSAAASHGHANSQGSLLGMMQGGGGHHHHHNNGSGGHMHSPGKLGSSPLGSTTSLQKRRNSGTMSALHVSSSAAPAAGTPAHGPSIPSSARKPPAYPSNPSTPLMLGRSLPINIGSGSGGGAGGGGGGSGSNSSRRNSGNHHAAAGAMLPSSIMHGISGGQSVSPTPPGTPPVLPIPRSMMPQSPLTPALGPDRSIPVINAQGQLQRVNSQQMNSYMLANDVQDVVLPPQAAPLPQQQTQGHHGGHHGNANGHHQHAHQGHHSHSHNHHHKAHPHKGHTVHGAGANGAAKQTHNQSAAHPTSAAATATTTTTPTTAPASPVPHTPVYPVKHLVKLSSLSSLSSLISSNATPAAPAAGASASAVTSPLSPSSAGVSSPSSPCVSPLSSPSPTSRSMDSPSSASSGPAPPVLHPAPPALAPTYIILDIDETIHVNAHSPCLMMCEKGLDMYQKIISGHANYRTVAYSAKSALTKTLQAALQSKRTVEENTATLLNNLQAANAAGNNIKIFGLTARFSHMASTTRKELLKLGIDLEKSSPFPQGVRKRMAAKSGNPSPLLSPSPPQERSLTPSPVLCASVAPLGSSPSLGGLSVPGSPGSGAAAPPATPYYPDITWSDHPSFGTDARYQSGVIYTNACEKGPVLSRFLEFLWGALEEENAEVIAHNTATHQAHANAVQQHAAAMAPPAPQQPQQQPPSSSPSLDDLAGQLASSGAAISEAASTPAAAAAAASAVSLTAMDDSSHSMMNIRHTVSNPITIRGGSGEPNSASQPTQRQPHSQPHLPRRPHHRVGTPSPPDSAMSLLTAASQIAQQRKGNNVNASAGGSAASSQSPSRRSSKTTDHLLPPPSSYTASVDVSSLSPSPSASPLSAAPDASALAPPVHSLLSLSLLPTRLIFIDDRLQNCFSVYDSLSAATLFDAYYNCPIKRRTLNHVPNALEVYTCHYVPQELAQVQPTNQTKADAAATAAAAAAATAHADAAPDLELIEAQIHHFLTHGEILNDSRGRALLAKLREQEDALKRKVAEADAQAKAAAMEAEAEHQRLAAAAAVALAASAQQAASAEEDRLRGISDNTTSSGSSVGSSVSSSSGASTESSCVSSASSTIMMEDCSSVSNSAIASHHGSVSSAPPTPPSPSLVVLTGETAAACADQNMASTPRNGGVTV